MRIEQLAARDGWECWICEGRLEPALPRTDPAAPTIDHVVPRARGGRSEPGNLRLAHRRCNGRRGDRVPELEWPEHLGVIAGAPLWQALRRARANRGGGAELVGLFATEERARAAAGWLVGQASLVVGGTWQAQVLPATAAEQHLAGVHLWAT